MSKMIQLRNVPDDVHRLFKVRAAQAGMTLSDYLLSELEVLAARPTMEEWLGCVDELNARYASAGGGPSGADLVRAGRQEHEAAKEQEELRRAKRRPAKR